MNGKIEKKTGNCWGLLFFAVLNTTDQITIETIKMLQEILKIKLSWIWCNVTLLKLVLFSPNFPMTEIRSQTEKESFPTVWSSYLFLPEAIQLTKR